MMTTVCQLKIVLLVGILIVKSERLAMSGNSLFGVQVANLSSQEDRLVGLRDI
jgi:hypothetical protein